MARQEIERSAQTIRTYPHPEELVNSFPGKSLLGPVRDAMVNEVQKLNDWGDVFARLDRRVLFDNESGISKVIYLLGFDNKAGSLRLVAAHVDDKSKLTVYYGSLGRIIDPSLPTQDQMALAVWNHGGDRLLSIGQHQNLVKPGVLRPDGTGYSLASRVK